MRGLLKDLSAETDTALPTTNGAAGEFEDEERVRRLISRWVERVAWRRALREKPID